MSFIKFQIFIMFISILSFGVAKDIVGQQNMRFEFEGELTVGTLRERLFDNFPDLKRLKKLAIALNDEYVSEEVIIKENDEIILIPPVSGG